MIRPMVECDAAAVAELIRAAFRAIETPLDPAPSALRETADSVRRQIGAGGGVVWDDGGVRGCLLWREQPDGLYVGRLAVSPTWWGRGIASLLLHAAETEARRLFLPKMSLAVRLPLESNRRLFRNNGFRETTLRTHDGYAAPTFVNAEKLL